MRVTVRGKELVLSNEDVKVCRKHIGKLIQSVMKICEEKRAPAFFFTFLIVMHTLSYEMLNAMDEDTIEAIVNRFNSQVHGK